MRTGRVLVVAVCAGCFDPKPPLDLPCGEGGVCPIGQRCDQITDQCIAQDSPDGVAVRFADPDSFVDEGDFDEIVIELTRAADVQVSVMIVAAGSAVAGVDYTLPEDTVVFAPGVTSETVMIEALDEALADPDETIELALAAPIGAVLDDDETHLVTIADTGVPVLRFDDSTSTAAEAGGMHSITIELSRPAATDVTFRVMLDGGSASAADFTAPTGTTFTMPQGTTSLPITTTILADALDEVDETFELDLLVVSGDATPSTNDHTVTIDDDDPPPTVTFDPTELDTTAPEGSGGVTMTFVYKVLLSTVSGRTVTVPVDEGGDADDNDYTIPAADIPVVFPAGTTSKTIQVTITADNTAGPDEQLILTLQSSSGATLGAVTTRTHSIVDDD